ncbi:uncharacterized protein LOC124312936 isoform X2 [Daphnia pulicaria]|uniref:uncharacterized protein LOC124312936 isoform X2 n=1 Tax=Daphnia pulicaria TaxID=35523 RepID=UPI001EEC66A0|nr:uncharacterized protein LOC124312936 isoform X2 [Daphnia pulicaria]
MANQECMEPQLKKGRIEETHCFTGKKLCCKKQLLLIPSWCGVLHHGYWRDNDQEKEVVVRRIQKVDCQLDWKNIVDQHLANSLNHENVLKIIGYEEDVDLMRYFALERFDATLEQYCNKQYTGPMPFKPNTLWQISSGLNFLHDKGLVHGQLNPSSILIVRSQSVLIKISDSLHESLQYSGNDCLLHPKYWMLPDVCSPNRQSRKKITFAFTVYGDVFAAGCLFFYYLSRGLHPFGNVNASIPVNIAKNMPVNLNRLGSNHYAYRSIKYMVGEPSQTGTQYLRIAAAYFKDFSPYEFKEVVKSVPEINGEVFFHFHPTLPILACCKCNRLTIFTASKVSIPFSSWKEAELKFEGQNLKKITALQWDHKGDHVAGFQDGCVAVWSYPVGEMVFRVKQHLEEVIAIYWSPSKHELFATYDRNRQQMLLWNSYPTLKQKTLFHTIMCAENIVNMAWTNNQQIIVGFDNSTIKIFQIDEIEPFLVKIFQLKDSIIRNLFWDEATQYLASVSLNKLNIWSLNSEGIIHSFKIDPKCNCFAWRPNNKTSDEIDVARKSSNNFNFAYGLSSGSIVVWNPFEETKKPLILDKHTDCVLLLVFSHDGKFLASTSKNEIIIWSTESWSPVFVGESDYYGLSWLTAVSNGEPVYKLVISSSHSVVCILN